jgi:hypothetical protein
VLVRRLTDSLARTLKDGPVRVTRSGRVVLTLRPCRRTGILICAHGVNYRFCRECAKFAPLRFC